MSSSPAPVQAIDSRLQWHANLNVNEPTQAFRKCSIICTIGPKTASVEAITALRNAGMNILRMNFSHGSYEYHGGVVKNARASTATNNRPLALALDTKGPEIRTGLMANDEEVPIPAGHEMTFSTDDKYAQSGSKEVLYIDYKNLPKVTDPGKFIFVDDGILTFEVLEVGSNSVKVRSHNAGKLCSKKGVNLPNTEVDLPAVSEKDKSDLTWGVEQGVDMIFASFIRRAEDVKQIRRVLGEKGKDIQIISKIENMQGVNNFDEILAVTDGVMVARGDLGIEIPAEKVFIAQKMMIAKCNIVGKPIICATQMLESMTSNPRPTRAEVSDVANAVLDGADCVMLSGETAKGLYPVKCVEMMHRICLEAESAICYPPLFNELRALTPRPVETTETVASSAVNAALEHQAGAILVLTTSGKTSRLISKYRPDIPILTVTRNAHAARTIHLYRGCYPYLFTKPVENEDKISAPPDSIHAKYLSAWQEDVDARIEWCMAEAKKAGILKAGAPVICIQGWRSGLGYTNTMRVVTCN